LRGTEPTAATPFPAVDDDSVAAGALLAGDRDAFERTVDRLPVPPVSARWAAVLDAAVRQVGSHWWLDHARAVRHHIAGEEAEAEAAYARSVEAHPTVPALRGQAVVATGRGDLGAAAEHYERARALDPTCRPLVTEQLDLLLAAGRPEACLAVIEASPRAVREHGRTRLQRARALAAAGDPEAADAILVDLEVEDLAEGDRAIGELWHELHAGAAVPARLDFRMTD
ncbi:MAG: tetratricopeptide repeat protein, partial [Nocardioides sp.]